MSQKLLEQLTAAMPSAMEVPTPIKQLYQWIEQQGFFIDNADDERIGFLYSDEKLQESQTENGRGGGTDIEFKAEGSKYLHHWFGAEHDEVNQRLCVFAKTGGEGSMAAFWLSDIGEVKIVHLGSGSGSLLNCVLADNSIDFLRLLAIGYDEICWDDAFSASPQDNDEFVVQPNIEFQNWVKETFQVTIPETALEIVKHPASMDDSNSKDEFWNWCRKFQQEETKEDVLAIAKLMKEVGVDRDFIIENTGLSGAEVDSLE
ncbi:hypothetical protein [Hymenobacter convexus]|uniref:hypothetical protein n=1 Tax=Hymenobacter sp. CA1UV-4 TaxID=3063782 RepID=UPI002713D708|nr:hypothetical protein [Hymenobacter sp. CA1UV-4]MDO7850502.1 hypothetical protein [Hymenobacter sp. CA1UV-4]